MNKSVGFIGSGRVTRFLLTGWQRSGKLPTTIVVSDVNAEALTALQAQFPNIRIAPNDNAQPAACDVVLIALHPPVIKEALTQLQGQLKSDALIISLAPKVSIASLSNMLGGFQRIARVNPNAPSLVNRGHNPAVLSPALTEADRALFFELFNALGACPEVPEDHLEAYAIVTAMGPTYLWFQLYELLELGQSFGLTPQELESGLTNMVNGVVATMFESGLTPAQVMDLVPVKPLSEDEAAIKNAYQTNLTGLYAKLKG